MAMTKQEAAMVKPIFGPVWLRRTTLINEPCRCTDASPKSPDDFQRNLRLVTHSR